MRLLMEIDYYKILFSKGANISELLSAVDGAVIVEENGGYGDPRLYVPKANPNISVRLIADNEAGLPENKNDFYEKYHEVKSENSELKGKIYTLEQKLKKIEGSIENT